MTFTRGSRLKASFTLEAALLMTFILPFLTAFLIFSFYLHDAALFQGTACETAAMGCNLQFYPGGEGFFEDPEGQKIRSRILWSGHVQAGGSASEDAFTGTCSGSFAIPGFTAEFLTGGSCQISRSWNRKKYRPASLIRRVRGLECLLEIEE